MSWPWVVMGHVKHVLIVIAVRDAPCAGLDMAWSHVLT